MSEICKSKSWKTGGNVVCITDIVFLKDPQEGIVMVIDQTDR